MKKYTNILVALGATLFLLIVGIKSEVKAQPCTIMKDTLTISGCQYEFQICVYCGLSYPGYVTIGAYRKLNPNCVNSLTPNQVLQQALTQLNTADALWLEFCQPLIPPCDGDERVTVEWRISFCWYAKLVNIIYPIPPGISIVYDYVYLPCNSDDYCSVVYTYCRDEHGVLQHTVDHYSPTGYPKCTLEGSQVVLPTNIGDDSDCYIYHSPCNP